MASRGEDQTGGLCAQLTEEIVRGRGKVGLVVDGSAGVHMDPVVEGRLSRRLV